MTFIKRAFLYSYRKTGKSMIVFLILLVMATLALSGITIKRAAADAEVDLRESLGGGLILQQDQSDSSKWETQQYEDGSSASYYNGPKIDKELAEKIADVSGIESYNAECYCPVILQDSDSEALTILVPEDSVFVGTGLDNQVLLYAYTDTSYSEFFTNKTVELVEGRHIGSDDSNAVIISRALAEKNNLKIGDKIIVTIDQSVTGTTQSSYNKAECEIVGLFDSASEQQTDMFTSTFHLTDNMVFMNIETYINEIDWSDEGYYKVHYTVSDPLELEVIKENVLKLEDVDWDSFKITLDDEAYQAAAGAIKNLGKSMNVMLVLVIIFSIAILALFLFMWVRSRTREEGILLSIGIPKSRIILQHITELLIVAVLAFGLSYFTSCAVSQGIGIALLNNADTVASETGEDDEDTITYDDSIIMPETTPDVSSVTEIETNIQPSDLIWIYLCGCAVIVSSVLISSIPIYRMAPKQILTKMR